MKSCKLMMRADTYGFGPIHRRTHCLVLHDGIGLILTCYGIVFYVATYYIHSLWT
ncbi:hypothetical protein DAEQUDRAFT_733857 [Daedalea quercina L-15889]|uniref:Uncharacterized protein n=1 Tax=Daedalea quercina L-15889 TaxID=1314783 RepID=A0A165KPE5_9APHY|nr:hypothetical protein DAEQUDRAFT_733857 [Daedalea quercina L-15889]